MEGLTADRVALVCVRDSRRFGLQVLLRPDAAKRTGVLFLEGEVEDRDRVAAALGHCHGRTGNEAQRFLGHDMSPKRALGFWAASVRVLATATGVCDLSRSGFFSRWVDPDSGGVTGFFLVHLPETVDADGFAWQAPETALLRWRDGGLSLDFPTFACLRILTDFSSCDSLLSEYVFT